jgi:hypothetical protein
VGLPILPRQPRVALANNARFTLGFIRVARVAGLHPVNPRRRLPLRGLGPPAILKPCGAGQAKSLYQKKLVSSET